MTEEREMSWLGAGGATRTAPAVLDLGWTTGANFPRRKYGIRRALWDIAFGYVSGFPLRDIAYFVRTRSLSGRARHTAFRREYPDMLLCPGECRTCDRTRMNETPDEKRTRLLADSDTKAWEYDLALDLGYEPESWEGMWKLTPEPFSYRHGCVIAREVVTPPTETADRVTRLVAHRLPDGWSLVEDSSFASATPCVHFVSPADQAWLKLFAETGMPPTAIMVTNALAADKEA